MYRQAALSAIYAFHAQWAAAYAFACHRGCTTCCTRSVTLTTLEGELILRHLRGAPELLPLLAEMPRNCPAPALTTNQFAAACLRGEVTEDPAQSWDLRPCVFLREGGCRIYPARPFMCRSFGSRVLCADQGEALVEPLFLTLNTIVMQGIEHLDRGRPWGNMNTILPALAATGGLSRLADSPRSQPLPGFLLLPEEEVALRVQLQALLALLNEEEQRTPETETGRPQGVGPFSPDRDRS